MSINWEVAPLRGEMAVRVRIRGQRAAANAPVPVAQPVEHWPVKPDVGGSIPPGYAVERF